MKWSNNHLIHGWTYVIETRTGIIDYDFNVNSQLEWTENGRGNNNIECSGYKRIRWNAEINKPFWFTGVENEMATGSRRGFPAAEIVLKLRKISRFRWERPLRDVVV